MEAVKKWNLVMKLLARAEEAFGEYQAALSGIPRERMEQLDSRTQELISLFAGVNFDTFLCDLPAYYVGRGVNFNSMIAPLEEDNAEKKE